MPSSNLQAIVISKDYYSKRGADDWIKLNGLFIKNLLFYLK